jgi:hypothetical protein
MPYKETTLTELFAKMHGRFLPQMGLTKSQYKTLLQFLDTGPYVATTVQLHQKLHQNDGYHRPPQPPIPLSTLKAALRVAKAL